MLYENSNLCQYIMITGCLDLTYRIIFSDKTKTHTTNIVA